MGIRYGKLVADSDQVEWQFVSHCESDGIGGFARVLRKDGAELGVLPQSQHLKCGFIGSLVHFLVSILSDPNAGCAVRDDWALAEGDSHDGPPKSVAWHLFTELETCAILDHCKRENATVNSYLLQHLDHAVRPDIKSPMAKIPWMIPVNLRGGLSGSSDTANQVSCIDLRIAVGDSLQAIQQQTRRRLACGEHWANHRLMQLGGVLSEKKKVRYLIKGRSKPHGNIGAFSNLGVWDSEKSIDTNARWIFCPPVVMGQLLGAGCVTFQNQLSLTVQSHADEAMVSKWMRAWVEALVVDGQSH